MKNSLLLNNSKGFSKFKYFSLRYPALYLILVLALVFTTLSPYFMTTGNMQTLMTGNTVVLIAAIGETLVLLTGGIDLSVSTVISASAVLAGTTMSSTTSMLIGTASSTFVTAAGEATSATYALSITVGVLTAILVGLVFGFINGMLIGKFKMSPFITTMGTQLVARGIAFVVSKGIAVKGTPPVLIRFGFDTFLGLPYIFLIGLALLLITAVIVLKSTWGRNLILLGANRKSAEYNGINVDMTEMSAYLFSGLFAGIAGFISIANIGNGIPGVGDTLLLIIIGGVVLGGTSMSGGEGSVFRTLIGITLLAVLTNGLNNLRVQYYDLLIIQGVLIFIGNAIATKMSQKSPTAM